MHILSVAERSDEGKLFKIIEKSGQKKRRIFLTRGAYTPYAPCVATPLALSETVERQVRRTSRDVDEVYLLTKCSKVFDVNAGEEVCLGAPQRHHSTVMIVEAMTSGSADVTGARF